jgi:hypothetical protein
MQIRYDREVGLGIVFPKKELKFALGVLRGIYQVAQEDFIQKAITDIENDLKPKAIPFVNHYRICEKCFCEIDIRTSNAIHYTGDQDRWVHRECKELKPDSQRER